MSTGKARRHALLTARGAVPNIFGSFGEITRGVRPAYWMRVRGDYHRPENLQRAALAYISECVRARDPLTAQPASPAQHPKRVVPGYEENGVLCRESRPHNVVLQLV